MRYTREVPFVGSVIFKGINLTPLQTVQDVVRFLRDGGKTTVRADDADEAAG